MIYLANQLTVCGYCYVCLLTVEFCIVICSWQTIMLEIGCVHRVEATPLFDSDFRGLHLLHDILLNGQKSIIITQLWKLFRSKCHSIVTNPKYSLSLFNFILNSAKNPQTVITVLIWVNQTIRAINESIFISNNVHWSVSKEKQPSEVV